jgi:ribosome-binding factor A
MSGYRTERVGRLLQEKIGALIVEGKIKDPRVDTFLSVTRVSMSRDLVYGDVYVSSYKSVEGLARGVAGLQSAAGFIQARLGEQLRMRHTPQLRFHVDPGIREEFELIKKIEGLAGDEDQRRSLADQ